MEKPEAPPMLRRALLIDRARMADLPEGETRLPIALSSEEPVLRMDWWTGQKYYEVLGHRAEEIDMSYAVTGLAFCLDHDTREQIGRVEDLAPGEDGLMRGFVRFGNHPDAAWVRQDMLDGIRPHVSIGYEVQEMEKVAEREGEYPTMRAKKWMPLECSTVAVPADLTVGVGRSVPTAGAPDLNARRTKEDTTMSTEKREAEATAVATPKEQADALAAAVATAAAEAEEIVAMATEAGAPERAAEFLKKRMSVSEVAKALLKESNAARTSGPDIVVRSGNGPVARDGSLKPFETVGAFLRAVADASTPGNRRPDPRLIEERAGSGQSIGNAADGGFAVPTTHIAEFTENMYNTGQILQRVRRIPSESGNLKITMIDETSRVDGSRSGAVQGFWAIEADTVTATRLKFRDVKFDTNKLFAIGYATEELLEDTPALEAVMLRAFQDEMLFKVEDAIINGTGNGQPLGILNSAAVANVAIEGSQTIANTAASIAINTAKMRSRLKPGALGNYVVLINQDIEPKIQTATLGGTAAAFPVYMPAGGLSASPYGSLLGRPVIPVEYCSAEGTPGDILFADLSQYGIVERGGIKSSSSIHVRFLNDEQTFKFTYRVDGKPLDAATTTPLKGSLSRASFVTLATRS
jgi:HK97 family phage major capsid protein